MSASREPAKDQGEAGPPGTRRLALFVVLLAAFGTNLTLTILTIALAPIAADFEVDVSLAAWITLAPIVVSAVLTPAAGRASDRFGRRRVFLLGMVVATIGILASGLAGSLPALVGARVVTGAGTALTFPSGLALITSLWPAAERGVPLGAWTSTVALSPALGVILGGLAVEHLSWRVLFFGQLPLCAVVLLLAPFAFREEGERSTAPFDVAGAVLGAVAVFGVLMAVNRGSVVGLAHPATLGALAAALVAGPLFVRVERRAAEPVFPLELLRDPPTRAALLSRAVLAAVYMGSFIVLPLLLLEVGHYTAGAVALALSPRPLAMGLAGPLVGRLSVRVPPASLAVAGGVALTVALLVIALYRPSMGYPLLFGALVLKGVALALSHTATATIVTSRTPVERLGTVSGALSITTSVANSVGMAAMLGLLELAGGEAAAAAYPVTFGAACLVAAVGTALGLPLLRAPRRAAEPD